MDGDPESGCGESGGLRSSGVFQLRGLRKLDSRATPPQLPQRRQFRTAGAGDGAGEANGGELFVAGVPGEADAATTAVFRPSGKAAMRSSSCLTLSRVRMASCNSPVGSDLVCDKKHQTWIRGR